MPQHIHVTNIHQSYNTNNTWSSCFSEFFQKNPDFSLHIEIQEFSEKSRDIEFYLKFKCSKIILF